MLGVYEALRNLAIVSTIDVPRMAVLPSRKIRIKKVRAGVFAEDPSSVGLGRGMKRSDSIVKHVLFLNFVGSFAMQLLCRSLWGMGV
jgi:hypothetical protein